MSTWYYAGAEREQLGPLSTDELKDYFRAARVTPDTLVWRDGMLHWRPLGELAQQLGLLEPEEQAAAHVSVAPPLVPPPPPQVVEVIEPELELVGDAPAPAPAGRAVFSLGTDPGEAPAPAYSRAEVAARVATVAQNDAIAANPYATGQASLYSDTMAYSLEDVVYAGFWKRVAASIIDSFIVGIAGGLIGEVFGAILSDLGGGGALTAAVITLLCTLVINVCYYAWFHSTLNFATPGKMAVGIKVTRGNGEPISFLRGVGRYFGLLLSTIVFFVGLLMAAFTERKRALHDLICDTVVVDKWAFTSHPERQSNELGMVAIIVLALYGLLLLLAIIGFFLLGMASAMLLR